MAPKLNSKKAFNSHNPATGEVVGTYPIYSAKEVAQVVARAREASIAWEKLGFAGRKKVLLSWSNFIINNIDQIASLVSLETGKPLGDAKLETSIAVSHIGWAARHAEEIMRTSYRAPGALMANMSATVERSPVGVVGVIGPWNYPIFTPVGSIVYALAAGNTVVFKPSEYTPGVGVWLQESFNAIAPFADIFTTITGLADTGNALCTSAIDKLSFTGSTRTAKLVAAACATNMTPVVLECGGKDPVIVAADANIDRAVDATMWSAMANAGQSCIGAERVYVHQKVAEKFKSLLVEAVHQLEVGKSYGPATMPKQLEVIKRHVADAQSAGAKLLIGDVNSIGERYVAPVVMADVPENCSAMTEETFGPTIAINTVASMKDAIELSNASEYGLGASVFSKRNGYAIAKRLEC
ncbi:MAG: aldehyde dehydrogenase family protein, partial [Actinobacteria bacterium]|nr:aldehyde dehydrogenase family protein [Actinomycetota bacterium]